MQLRDSPAFREPLPGRLADTSDQFPWQPVVRRGSQEQGVRQGAARSRQGARSSARRGLRTSESKRLVTAFSQKLHVQEIIETLPKPEKELLEVISKNCQESYTSHHTAAHAAMEVDPEQPEAAPQSSSPSVSASSVTRRPLRRSKRKLEESGTRGMRSLSPRDRATLLRPYGALNVDKLDTEELASIQTSRRRGGGCSCRDGCVSAACECARNSITCHLEWAGFPCACLATCANPWGRRVFDHVAVALHFINTMFTAEGVMEITEREESVPSVPAMEEEEEPVPAKKMRR